MCVCVSASPSLELSDHSSFRAYSLSGLSFALSSISEASPHGGYQDERIIHSGIKPSELRALTIPVDLHNLPLEKAHNQIKSECHNPKTADYLARHFCDFADTFSGEVEQDLIDANKQQIRNLALQFEKAESKEYESLSNMLQAVAAGFYKNIVEIIGGKNKPTVLDGVRFISERRGFEKPILSMPPASEIQFVENYNFLPSTDRFAYYGRRIILFKE